MHARLASHADAAPRGGPPGSAPPKLGRRRRVAHLAPTRPTAIGGGGGGGATAATSAAAACPWWGDPAAAVAAAAPTTPPPPPWRLGDALDPGLASLLAAVESAWMASGAGAVPLDEDIAYKDSHAGGDGSTPTTSRFRLENRVYSSQAFRKLHLEAAVRADGLAVLHGVAVPWVDYPIPILAFDLVAAPHRPKKGESGGGVGGGGSDNPPSLAPLSLAIIDPCPISADRSLPADYAAAVSALQASSPAGAASNRTAPEWGAAIFSDACVLARPGDDAAAAAAFGAYAADLNALHLAYADALVRGVSDRGGPSPLQGGTVRTPDAQATAAAHARWAGFQLQNDRTRRVLAASFGEEWAGRYMAGVMFDVEEL